MMIPGFGGLLDIRCWMLDIRCGVPLEAGLDVGCEATPSGGLLQYKNNCHAERPEAFEGLVEAYGHPRARSDNMLWAMWLHVYSMFIFFLERKPRS